MTSLLKKAQHNAQSKQQRFPLEFWRNIINA